MKAWLQDGDQWKAENLAGFCNWPITRCFIQNDRARLIIEHSTNFVLSGNIDGPCNTANNKKVKKQLKTESMQTIKQQKNNKNNLAPRL